MAVLIFCFFFFCSHRSGVFRVFQFLLKTAIHPRGHFLTHPSILYRLMRFLQIARSSHRKCSVKKGFLRNFAKFTGKQLCQNLFFDKVAGLRPATLLKKRLWHRRFPVNFAKFLKIPFLTEHLRMISPDRLIGAKTCTRNSGACLTPIRFYKLTTIAF